MENDSNRKSLEKRGGGGGGGVDKGNQSDGPIHLAKLIDASLGGSNCGLN